MIGIDDNLFWNCSSLKKIYSKTKIPPRAKINSFNGVTTSVTLYVPVGSKEAYATAIGWKNFTNIVEMNFDLDGDINSDGVVSVTDIQSLVNLILSSADVDDNSYVDINGDGVVSVTDIQCLVNIILNVE